MFQRTRRGAPWEAQPSRWARCTPRCVHCRALVGGRGSPLACALHAGPMGGDMSKVPGRLYATAAVLFILCGIGHTIGQYSPDVHGEEIAKRLRTFTVPGTSFNYWNVMQCWGALYGAMTVAFGVAMLAVKRTSGGDPRVIRATSWIGAAAAFMQAAVSLFYATPPPAFFMFPACALLLFAARWPEKQAA